ncbi:hypothetical protein C0995_014687 [Termitomyces sp. Mi166|nr:hypothetical protein C0995_014687 [Termitomyces sp. Mi166\
MDTIKNILSPLAMNTGAIQDTLKLVVIGGTVETARRVSVSAWNGFIESHFSQEDYPYDCREFEITTRSVGRSGLIQSTAGDLEDEEDEDEDDGLVHGRRKRKVAFMPSVDTTHTIYYRGHWLRITRTKRYPDYGQGSALKISVVARNNDILKKLVLEAKREYEKDAEHRVHIFLADTTYGGWRWNGARQKRPMSSIVLQPGVKDMLLADCKDFLASEEWYAERDLDAAFTRSVSRDSSSTGTPTAATASTSSSTTETSDGSTLSLSGLLNSLDGVAAAEGRLLFATTNHIERLDPALSRPGRMDVWVNFTHATKWQAEGIFKCFFPCKAASINTTSNAAPTDASQKNLPLSKRKVSAHVIPLLSEEEISKLAKRFAAAIPEDELSVAALQGYLLKNKTRPRECVDEVEEWIIQERETREKLKKEKAEREAKEKKEAEEKEKKEKEEKEAKEKEQKELKEKLERKEARAKAKKAAAKEVAKSSSSTVTTSSTPTETASPAEETTTESSASSESEGTGVDADTEESITSDDDAEKSGDNKEEGTKETKEKWVAVKGTTIAPDTSTATPAADAGP